MCFEGRAFLLPSSSSCNSAGNNYKRGLGRSLFELIDFPELIIARQTAAPQHCAPFTAGNRPDLSSFNAPPPPPPALMALIYRRKSRRTISLEEEGSLKEGPPCSFVRGRLHPVPGNFKRKEIRNRFNKEEEKSSPLFEVRREGERRKKAKKTISISVQRYRVHHRNR